VLISAFAVLALILGCIGIYAAMAYAVTQRTQEIGVRMALGARREDVLRMILGSGLRITLLGVAIGLAGTLAVSRLLSSPLFQVSAMNPLIFSSAGAANDGRDACGLHPSPPRSFGRSDACVESGIGDLDGLCAHVDKATRFSLSRTKP
jgi:hypothetical protein